MSIDVRKVSQEIVVPELREIKSDIRIMKSDLTNFDKRFTYQLESMDKRFDSIEKELNMGFTSLRRELETALELRERIVALESKLSR